MSCTDCSCTARPRGPEERRSRTYAEEAMYLASDSDLKASLLLADQCYDEVQARKVAQRSATRKGERAKLAVSQATEEQALRYASKVDKEGGRVKRARDRDILLERLEREEMAQADEDSRVRMTLISEKFRAMDAANQAHVRRFDDPRFHFVPRRKMIQIQSGCIDSICQVLDKNNRTNTWQTLDACVVEQCLSVLGLYVHRRPERCRQLQDSKGGVQAIVTGMRECTGNSFVQGIGIKLVADTCLTLESCAEAFGRVGAFEAIVGAMEEFVDDGNLQACACDAISAVVAALPVGGELQARIFEARTHLAAGQALRRHTRSEDVLVAGMRALETIAQGCGILGQRSAQEALSTQRQDRSLQSPDGSTAIEQCSDVGIVNPSASNGCPTVADDGITTTNSAASGCVGYMGMHFSRGGEAGVGATGFALRVADSYSRDGSSTIVRRAGAARVAASAFNLLRALLTDCKGNREDRKGSLPSIIDEFCAEQGVETLISAMEHHLHDAILLIAAWQAMHVVGRLAKFEQQRNNAAEEPNAARNVAMTVGESKGEGETSGAASALHRANNLEQTVRAAITSMDVHLSVAPLQWICLVCLADLYALDPKIPDVFVAHGGCQILNRCIRTNSRHTAVVEQGCRVVAAMSELSFTSRTRFFVEKIQDAIHEVVFLHRRHPGAQILGNRALDALWGADEFGAKQKEAAAQRLRKEADEDSD